MYDQKEYDGKEEVVEKVEGRKGKGILQQENVKVQHGKGKTAPGKNGISTELIMEGEEKLWDVIG